MISGVNGHPSFGGVVTGNYFWFIANSVAPQRLDYNATCFRLKLVVSAGDQATSCTLARARS